jgi:hypothetical protein
MPRSKITPQRPTFSGIAPTYEPANVDGNAVDLGGGRVVHVKNASAGSITVTLPTPGTVAGLAISDQTITVAAGGEQMFTVGDSRSPFKQPDLTAHIDYSAVTSVTVAVFAI